METFIVYPKEAKPFPLTCERFELKGNEFILYQLSTANEDLCRVFRSRGNFPGRRIIKSSATLD